ncbi:hypothetical protein CHS0354_032665 [Potamilus streckersoni]|uniref:U3 small nucleolar RNA-associated protein 11 n=1 Tax=Potamilus streckersoni TaxID=2493646 RepID=A0AAE0TFQ6_9BIVA|nr:hypothetical protein CHS0354_032665 [Potamilus streckersoni]
MSNLRKAAKSGAKTYRERSQPESRAHLGFLEKKKDYKLRAEDYQRKQTTIKVLKRKALDRNPDEFYFNMVKTQKVDGEHRERESAEPETTETQLKMMLSQDQRYVNMKKTAELRKIEKLKSSLHMIGIDKKPQNKHIIFVDSKKEVQEFDPAKYFNTHPSLVDRVYNRPTIDALKRGDFLGDMSEEYIKEIEEEKEKKYKELARRIAREKELSIISQKMEMKKHLLDKKARKIKVQGETKITAAQYRWCYQRKR